MLFSVMILDAGCDGTPSDVVASKAPAAVSTPGRITLSAEESSRVGLEVQPVVRSDFRTLRYFPAIVQPNQRNMAEITTLVRGRVIEVYADLGQEVKANAPLAISLSPLPHPLVNLLPTRTQPQASLSSQPTPSQPSPRRR